MTTPIRLLALSYYYPPANNPRAIQVARLLEYLKVPTLLICGDDYATDDRMDPNLNQGAESFLEKCLRVPFVQPTWKRISAKVAHQFDVHLWEKAPDRYRDWKPIVMSALRDFDRESHYSPDLIVTFGSPMSDHLIGIELKKKYRVPWIAHFSDPWVENLFKGYNAFTRSINVGLERKVIQAADRVVFTSQETADVAMKKYPEGIRSKARVLPHAYEPKFYEDHPVKDSSSSVTIRYLGDLYLQRTPAPLFRALRRIVSSHPRLLDHVCFEFVGTNTDFKLSEVGYDELPQGLVVFKPTVDYATSLTLMSSADGLLVIDAPAPSSVFLPSKLIDYIGADRPILGITPPGTASKLITELGGWVSNPSNEIDTENALRAFISFLKDTAGNHLGSWGNQLVRQRFEPNIVAANFRNIIDELLPSRG